MITGAGQKVLYDLMCAGSLLGTRTVSEEGARTKHTTTFPKYHCNRKGDSAD